MKCPNCNEEIVNRLFRYDINKDFDDVESFKISERIYKIGNGLKTMQLGDTW